MQLVWRLFQPKAIGVFAWCVIQLFLLQVPLASAQFDGGGMGGGSSGPGDPRDPEGGMCAPECWCSGFNCADLPLAMCEGCPQGENVHEERPGGTIESTPQEISDRPGENSEGTSLACMNGTPCNLAYVQALLVCLAEVDVLPILPPGIPTPPPGIQDPIGILRRMISPGVKQAFDAVKCSVCTEAVEQGFSMMCDEPLVQGPWELGGGGTELCLENAVSGGTSTYLSWLWDAYENQLSCASQGVP